LIFVKNSKAGISLLWAVGLHLLALILVTGWFWLPSPKPTNRPLDLLQVDVIQVPPPQRQPASPANKPLPASKPAPPAPTAEEWALASTYTLKNSKRYRNTWGQQVRSMMGTAHEGPDQGAVRFAIEIAPDGRLTKVQTIWSTSDKAEKLARQAIANLPPLPPTPTGQPLVFEKTISFQPFEDGWPPIYKFDCLPDPPKYGNPFAWDGQGAIKPPAPAPQPPVNPPTECPDAPQDSLEAEAADMQRQFNLWESSRLTTHPQ
jgi:TonB family protein